MALQGAETVIGGRADESAQALSKATERERWELVQRIFHAAVEVSDASRDGFVRRACERADGFDAELEAEVKALLGADRSAGDYMEEPLVAAAAGLGALFDAPLAPGDVLCERFEIVRSIAEGGMGHVFEALDRELHVRVALKVIRPEIAAVPEALARFRQEVRLARTITHPNVCRTFDIDRDARKFADGREHEVVFLTMELLAGETLAAKIKREGALKLDETLELAKQMAAALDAAHALGVVHRDMKPANVMLVPMPGATGASGIRAVITDFGLARLDPVAQAGSLATLSQTSLGKTGQPIGTLAYMAPEQLEGGPVSPATDVYGLGLILYEMVTGRRAFASGNPLSGLTERLTGPPPAAKAVAAGLPARWSYGIEGCLRVKAAERFQRAGEAVAVLEGHRGRMGMIGQGIRAGMKTRRGRWAAIAAGILVGVSLFAGGVRLYERTGNFGSAEKVAAGALVYLAPVKNETGEPRLDNVTELLEAGLAQSAQINLLDQGKVGDILEHMTKPPDTKIDPPIAREIAMRSGAVRVVFATISGRNGRYTLDMEVQQPDNSPILFRKRVRKSFGWSSAGDGADGGGAIAPELLSAVRDASDWVRHEVGESAGDIARLDVPPEDVTTSSWEALAEYAQAERLVAGRQWDKAVDVLRDAVQTDPGFATAYARLADVLDSLLRVSEGYEAYRKAMSVTLRSRLSRRERDRILGMFAMDTGDQASAEAAFRDYATYYEQDYAGWFFRAYPLMMLGRTPEAIETLKHAYALDPNRVSAPAHLARYYMIAGNLPEAWRWQRWLDSHGFKDDGRFAAGLLYLQEGHYDAAEGAFQGMLSSADPYYRSLGEALLTRYFAERGDFQRALSEARSGIAWDKEKGIRAMESSQLLDAASLQCRLGQANAAAVSLREAVVSRPAPETFILASSVLGQCADTQPSSRKVTARMLEWLAEQTPKQDESFASQEAVFRVKGELFSALGMRQEALSEFLKADGLEPRSTNREYLARAYRLASEDAAARDRSDYRAHAVELYRALSDESALNWTLILTLPPGAYADCLGQYLRLGDPSSVADGNDAGKLREVYRAMRNGTSQAAQSGATMLVQ
jgi:serine/threonine protein kinase/tetratricopeptide (TPR) repeat protein